MGKKNVPNHQLVCIYIYIYAIHSSSIPGNYLPFLFHAPPSSPRNSGGRWLHPAGNLTRHGEVQIQAGFTIGKPWENHGKMMFFCGILWDIPSGYVKIALENDHRNS